MAIDPNRLNQSAAIASVSVAVLLVALKLWALGETGALSVAASLADSVMDLIVSLAGLAAVTYAARPPDEDHTFGHTSIEDLVAFVQSLFLLVSAGAIGTTAVRRLSQGTGELASEGAGIAIMSVSIVVTLALVLWQRHVARVTNSRVIKADSLHYISDLVPNIGAIVSLWASASLGMPQIDSIVALAAAAMLVVGAFRIGSGAWHALMDRAADPKLIAGIKEISTKEPGILGVHDIKTRTAGARVFVNMHVEIDGTLSLREAHDIGERLHQSITTHYPEADVIIHHDPV